jgi:dipeptidyl aminopeptidase/acylaminoacyl peptidase
MVRLGQALYLDRALRRYDVEHQLVVHPREGHGIWERAHQIDVLSRTVAWFDTYLVKS